MIAVMGDAELDEGNVFEALLEGWKHDVRNLWWIIDYNRQSLDGVTNDFLFRKIRDFFRTVGWKVVILKYGKRLEAAFEGPAGEALKKWIDDCPNPLYSALCFKGGASWRQHLTRDLGGASGLKTLLDSHDDASLHALMTNLAGHDMESMLEAFHAVKSDAPHCFVAYTIKGMGLPLAGHKDNHSGLMTPDQMEAFRAAMGIAPGREWDRFAGLAYDEATLRAFLEDAPLARVNKTAAPPPAAIAVAPIAAPAAERMSTQEAFGRIMTDLGKRDDELGRRIVTTSPDVTVSTNLGGWVNQKLLFNRERQQDVFRLEGVPSPQPGQAPGRPAHRVGHRREQPVPAAFRPGAFRSAVRRAAAAGRRALRPLHRPRPRCAHLWLLRRCPFHGRRHAVGRLAGPEGGAHQSVTTPLIGLGQPGLTAFEPAFADELAAVMEWGFAHMQAAKGGSVYLRLSTRPIHQPARPMTAGLRDAVLSGGYWLREPAPGAEMAIVYTGVVAPEALEAFEQIREDIPGAGLLAVTSADRLHAGWRTARRARAQGRGQPARIETLLGRRAPDAALISVIDGHPATLAWIGGVGRYRVYPLGVDRFGQSGDIPDLYRLHGIDAAAILDAAAAACLERLDGIP